MVKRARRPRAHPSDVPAAKNLLRNVREGRLTVEQADAFARTQSRQFAAAWRALRGRR